MADAGENDVIAQAFKWAEAHQRDQTTHKPRTAFARNTGLALEAHREILEMELDENDPHYKSKLQAKAAAASQQLIAALRADENNLKAAEVTANYYEELRAMLDDYRAKHAEKQLEYRGE